MLSLLCLKKGNYGFLHFLSLLIIEIEIQEEQPFREQHEINKVTQ